MEENPTDECMRLPDWNHSRLELWNSFCRKYRIAEDSVPLFECDENNFVLSKEIGASRPRKILLRSFAMEDMMRREAKKVVDDHKANTRVYDGIIYIMHTRGGDGGLSRATSGSLRLWGRLLEFYRLILRASRQIRRNLLGGATTMPTISVI
jgi:hypothetical protein